MEDRLARRLSWLTTFFCSLYVEWTAFHLGTWMGSFGSLLRGIDGPLPPTTLFAAGLSKGVLLVAGTLLVAGLVAKEFLVRRTDVRHVITFMVFMSVSWFSRFCVDAIYKPLLEIIDKLG
jgi:hypothetical protein